MPNYLCMQRSLPDTAPKEPGEAPSPSQMEAMYAKFNAWRQQYKDNIVDMGGKLKTGKIATSEGITDGPFVEAKELIGGYMILSADSLDHAVEIATSLPMLVRPGSGVEVREIDSSEG